jgi:F0F1-type ATP synthase assembly protein I
MIEPGRGLAYLALFSEIGVSLLVTTLLGVLIGYWADQQLGTVPILTVIGFFAGAGIGTVAIYKLVSRFLEKIE